MNTRGFTLIELLGVIVILSIISLITIPIIDRSLNKGKENLSTSQKEQLIKSLKDYYADSKNSRELYSASDGATFCKTINDLKNYGYLPANVKNPLTGKDYDSMDKVCVQKLCQYSSCKSDSYENSVRYKYCISINGSECNYE